MTNNNLHLTKVAKTFLISLLLSTIGVAKGFAYGFSAVCSTGQTLYYNITNNSSRYVELTYPGSLGSLWNSYTKPTGNLIIPSEVTYNGKSYYVKSIGSYAFSECSGLTSLSIGNSVTDIASSAFRGCTGINQITVASGNTVYDSRNNCNAIIKTSTNVLLVGCKQTVIPNTVTSIGDEAFYLCSSLSSINIPNSVTSIGSSAFRGCTGLTSVNIPQSVNSIGNSYNNPFAGCSGINQITVASGNTVYDSRNNCNAIIKTNTNELIVGCKQTVIPNTITSIGEQAFCLCSSLSSINIPNSVTTIKRSAFSSCTGLTSIIIPNSVNYIEDAAFSECQNLAELTIGEGVTQIGGRAFWDCPQLTIVHFNAINCAEMSDWRDTSDEDDWENVHPVFSSSISWATPNITTVIIGENVQNIPSFAFKDCSNIIGELTIPNSVTTINGLSFYNCTGLTSLTLGNSLNAIYSWAFRNCSGVSSITILDNTPANSDYAFLGINRGIPVFVPCGKASVYASSYYYDWRCFTNYQEQNMNNLSVTSNDEYLGTAEITQQATCSENAIVTAIPNAGVFLNWTENGEVVSTDNPYSFELTSDRNLVANFALVEVVEGDFKYTLDMVTGEASVKAYNYDLTTSSFASSITHQGIDYAVTSIANDGFEDCVNITEMIIPNSIVTIGSGAFARCRFTKAIIPSSVTTIGQQAFFNCTALKEVVFEDGDELITLGNNKYSDGVGGGLFENCPVKIAYIGRNIAVSNYHDGYNYPWTNAPFSRWQSSVYAPLSEVIIGNGVTKLCDYFFNKCNAVTSIVSYVQHPGAMNLGTSVFSQIPKSTCVLYVPENSINKYQNTAQWSDFTNIQEMQLGIIAFADENVKNVCVNHWDTNGDGEINYTEAEAVTSLGYVFKNNNTITSFNELQYFTRLTEIDDAFMECNSLTSIVIPSSVTTLGNNAFYNCNNLTVVMMQSITPPILDYSIFQGTTFPIYVPYESLNDYKTASYWSDYASRIYPMAHRTIPGYGTSNGKWAFIASPLTTSTAPTAIDDMIATTAIEYDLYRFNQAGANGEWENYKVHGFDLTNGQGYLYANKSNVNLVFKGDFNENTTQDVPLSYVSGTRLAGYNLVGNPFPVNAYSSRPYYVMNADGDAVIATAISTNEPIAPCTGVIVQAMENENNPTVTFSTTAPATSNKGNLSIMLCEVDTRRGTTGREAFIDNAIVSFNEGDQLGKFVFNEDNAKLYIPQNGKEYAIACIGDGRDAMHCVSTEVPVNFKATRNGEYTLTVNPENVGMDYLHLIDNLTGNDVDLLQTPSYTFTAKADDYASRFRLVFRTDDDNLDNDDNFAYISNGEIRLLVETCHSASLQVIDVTGRVIVERRDAMHCVSTDGIVPGVYVLRLVNGENMKTQKIVIK